MRLTVKGPLPVKISGLWLGIRVGLHCKIFSVKCSQVATACKVIATTHPPIPNEW